MLDVRNVNFFYHTTYDLGVYIFFSSGIIVATFYAVFALVPSLFCIHTVCDFVANKILPQFSLFLAGDFIQASTLDL